VLRPGGGLVFSVWGALADNPLGRIAHDVIGRFFTSDPPDFYEVPFGFHDERLIRRLLGDAGFEVAGCHPVSLPARSPSHLDAARGLVTGNPILLAVNERATAPVEEIVQAVAAALAAEGGVAPFELETRALVVVARAAPTPSKGESDYVITPARPRDVPHLAAIERDAAQLLRGHAPDSLLDQTLDPAELFAAQAAGLLWVALRGDVPVGFALVRILAADLPHLEEIDVDPRHGRRGRAPLSSAPSASGRAGRATRGSR